MIDKDATGWVIVGVYCDGTGDDGAATRHRPQVIQNYRRLVDVDGTRTWAPIYSAAGENGPRHARRDWLDADDNPAPPFDADARRANDTFTCEQCGFNLPRRWDDIERTLDQAHAVGWGQVVLRQWANRLR
ncbi:hypothetical protein [Mycolicibacillus trivialis]|uniref:hypothetical protein n=1 Tax=Mycolicibacillus trivialis TaxID=1798 RepID=UPI00105664E7|nr:hypothetical protein [Mycolicibacillus trivialis]